MKKNKLHIKITAVLSVLVAFVFTSCFDPIYNSISTDVKPEKPTVSGNINSIARYNANGKEFLVTAANGGIRYKDALNDTHGSWKTYPGLPFSTNHNDFESGSYMGEDILKVVADQENLYIATVTYNKESSKPKEFKIWSGKINKNTTKDDWKVVVSDSNTLKLPFVSDNSTGRHVTKTYFNIFYTNDYEKENRHAYIRIGDPDAVKDEYKSVKYYELQGTSEPVDITITVSSADTANDTSAKCINSAVVFDSTTYFFNSPVSISNGKFIYYGNGENLYYGKPEETFTRALSAGSNIASLATCSDAILIGCGNTTDGTAGGIKKTSLTAAGIPGSALTEFTTNAKFQMHSSYMITCLLNATPDNTELNSNLYSTITFPGMGASGNAKEKDKGLWSYYPKRGNWNRE